MALLQDIQNAAVDGNSSIGVLLRTCRLPAARLKGEELSDWVVHELNGYPADADLPSYRVSVALTLEAADPAAGEPGQAGSEIRLAAVTHLIQTIIVQGVVIGWDN